MRLGKLCATVAGAQVPAAAAHIAVRGVQSDSRAVTAGDVFVAVPGERDDGRAHAAEAVARGAVAIVTETPVDAAVPQVIVPDARRALARLAAVAAGNPIERLRTVGITGTLGKTSVLTMLQEILRAAGISTGSVGSLGIDFHGGGGVTPNTTPGSLQLQRNLADMVDAGTEVLAMEVTSHALLQDRVHGIRYDLGVFTNLTMLEHLEYHGSFRAYAEAKRRFLDHLEPQAPLVYSAGDRAVSQMVRTHPGPLVPCGAGGGALVSVRRDHVGLAGSRVTLTVRRPLPRVNDQPLPPVAFPLALGFLGRTNIGNAVLATVAALSLGADPAAAQKALGSLRPPRRRLEVIRRAAPVIIDDTVGHPDSITAVFEVARQIPHHRLHIVFCIRGQRGPVINQRDAEAVAIWSRQVPVHRIITTCATDTADERNAVTDEERSAFIRVLANGAMAHAHHDRLVDAIDDALAGCDANDLLLLLGAQGMDAGADRVRQVLGVEG
jgi:UDP-N-acetylmuramoyl-L-alanyl-D-glutamate--2,6-diaminopimelate ligase